MLTINVIFCLKLGIYAFPAIYGLKSLRQQKGLEGCFAVSMTLLLSPGIGLMEVR